MDGTTLILPSNKGDHFTFIFMPLLEIGLKLSIAVVSAILYFTRKGQKEELKNE